MSRIKLLSKIALVILFFTSPAFADEKTLQNDGFNSGDVVAAQGGFAAGEKWAGKFSSVAGDYPLTITSVSFLFAGAASTQNTTVRLYAPDATAADLSPNFPGTELYSAGEYQIQGSDSALSAIDLSAENWTVASGAFWISFDVTHNGFPGPSRDNDGSINASVNAINAEGFGWVSSSTLGLTGDWVLRVTVQTASGTPVELEAEPDIAELDVAEPDVAEAADVAEPQDTAMDAELDIFSPDPLTITSIDPGQTQFGTEQLVQIRGTGFVDGTTVRLGTTSLTGVVISSDTIIQATVPNSLAIGVYDLIAQTPSGALFTYPSAFEVKEGEVINPALPPAITGIVPDQGMGGDTATVTGLNFQTGASLNFGPHQRSVIQSADLSQLTFTIPVDAEAGTYDLTVTNPDGQKDTLANGFTVVVAQSTKGDDSGCGCTLASRTTSNPALLLVGFGVFALLVVGRRRR
ncbi:MAG: hypothetical protein CO108_15185 [Deltaproteobacteria bacterium CG_4_9_14_3_um_filter_63_12]|nr:MAG: hypothetical protein CO108_15185 [Deltaproteobacteria bacterium CG_4_9_14_3_um_filter_63_12]